MQAGLDGVHAKRSGRRAGPPLGSAYERRRQGHLRDRQGHPLNPTGDRFTGERFEKALNITLNSVVFRSSGQELTTTGTYVEMAFRVTEPVLLGLGVLAIRNRVKR